MKTMTVTAFKAHALQVISNVFEMSTAVVVTKRGKAIAEIIPFKPHEINAKPGKLASALVTEKDLILPIDEKWESNR